MQYDVYGIGNALVDMEFQVSDEFLEKNGIAKGMMTLIDAEREKEILVALKGESPKMSCGGSAANTTIAVRQFGGNVFYSCKVAADHAGEFYYKDLLNQGAKTNLSGEREKGLTGKCIVLITPDGERTMNTHLGITEQFSEKELVLHELKKSSYLYVEGYLVTKDNALDAAVKARMAATESDIKTSLTLSDPGVVAHFRDGFKKIIGKGVDLIFSNEKEAIAFSEGLSFQDSIEYLKKFSKSFVITRGEKGAVCYDGEMTIEVPTKKVKALDANGAGDLFAGSFLYGITHGMSYPQAAKMACESASELVTHLGPRLPNDNIDLIRSKYFKDE